MKLQSTTSGTMEPPHAALQTPTQEPECNTKAHITPNCTQVAAQPTGSVTYIPTQCSPLIPVFLSQQQGNGPYALYLHPSSARPNPLARPQPTSLAVRSMTFEDKTGQSPTGLSTVTSQQVSSVSDGSPMSLKRHHSDSASESSPSKAKRLDPSFKVKIKCIHCGCYL